MAESSHSISSLLQPYLESQLPILSDLESLSAAVKDSKSATGDIFKLARFDPVFCLYAQKLAGERQAGKAGEIVGLEHALSMIGVDGVAQLVPKLQVMPNDGAEHCRQVLAEALLASEIAEQLAKVRGGNVKEAAASALFARASEWITYWQTPEKFKELTRAIYSDPFNFEVHSENLLGYRQSELQLALAENFFMPSISGRAAKFNFLAVVRELLRAIKLFRSDDLLLEECSRELRFHLGGTELLPVIANRLSQILCMPWLQNSWGRWIDIAAIHCHKKINEVEQIVIQSCRKLHRFGIEFPIARPGCALVKIPGAPPHKSQKTQDASGEKEKKETFKPTPLRRRKEAKYTGHHIAHIRGLYRKLIDSPKIFETPRKVVEDTLQLLIDKSPLERVSFMVIGKDGDTIKSLLSLVKDNSEPAPVIKTQLSKTKVWQKFTAKPVFLTFSRLKHDKFWSQLPEAIVNDERVDVFLLNSILYNGRVRAFLYADMALTQRKLPEELVNDFKRIASGLGSALRSLS
ncbi:HDOD domain-containing protein [Pleionea sediminis]|uniref:HDOD domain-containing protein n=1 Tax=Pleionea sediminis TaxID=2569479 RepID=UPI001186E331|nr:HDOD domain-containing protein [Pleionea sediminis]